MKKLSNIEIIQGINEKVQLIDDRLWKYFNLIYSEDSNDIFDEEHDSLLWHIEGWKEEKHEMYEEMYCKDITREKLIRILHSLDHDFQFTMDLQLYYQSTQNISKKPKYIYG
jgi:hypothetical protein